MYRRVPTLYVQCCIALAAPKTASGSGLRLLVAGWLVFGEKSNLSAKIILRLRCANDLPVRTAPHRTKGYAGGVVLRGRNPYTSLVTPSSFFTYHTTKRPPILFNSPEGRIAGPTTRRHLFNQLVCLPSIFSEIEFSMINAVRPSVGSVNLFRLKESRVTAFSFAPDLFHSLKQHTNQSTMKQRNPLF